MAASIDLRLAIHVLKMLGLVIGGIISARSVSAYFRTRDRDLGLFALGFVLLTIGITVSELMSFYVDDLLLLILVESFFVLIGFISMFLAFYVKLTQSYRIPRDTDIILGDDRYGFTFEDVPDQNEMVNQFK